jgi:RNA recognition motif-containing protein
MATKLYVGNLDYGVTSEQLGEHFAQAGKVVEANVISDRYTGRSKGFAFVEMSSEEEAKKAIEMFNDKDFQGRNIVVNEARPKREPSFGRDQRGRQ